MLPSGRFDVGQSSPWGRVPRTLVAVSTCLSAIVLGSPGYAHEHEHTHYNLTRAAFRLLDSDFFRTGDASRPGGPHGGLTERQIEDELAQGVIDEDECKTTDDTGSGRDWGSATNWNSHFFEAKTGARLGISVLVGLKGCEHIRFGTHTNAADRARHLFGLAVEDYEARKFRSAYRILGRVMHLMQDMTSPPHVHDDPHGELVSDCGGDADDFERWGFCGGIQSAKVCEYFFDDTAKGAASWDGCIVQPPAECHADYDRDGQIESYGVPPAGFTCRLWSALQILYDGKSRGDSNSADPVSVRAGEASIAFAFIRHVANITYDFTTFRVHLQDVSPLVDEQPASELKSMLRGGATSDCNALAGGFDFGLCEASGGNGWRIRGTNQDIGFTVGAEGSTELAFPDSREEWWLMPTGYSKRTEFSVLGGIDIFVDGFAYLENAGGEGPLGLGDVDSFVPLRYGCTSADSVLCGDILGPRSKVLYQELYGTNVNRQDPFKPVAARGKTMLQIYGDALYTTAVAYGAGLIQAFVDEVTVPPIAHAGGPYTGEACQLINLDASESLDRNGTIESYEWDFTDDGAYDVQTADAVLPFAYPSEFAGFARLRVTDNDGLADEDIADVEVTPDVTAPSIEKLRASPRHLWPPNHKMIAVTLSPIVDDACGATACRIIQVTSNEPVTSRNDRTSPDWLIRDELTVDLRSEGWRGKSPLHGEHVNREYTVTVQCTDAAGNSAARSVLVPTNPDAPAEDTEEPVTPVAPSVPGSPDQQAPPVGGSSSGGGENSGGSDSSGRSDGSVNATGGGGGSFGLLALLGLLTVATTSSSGPIVRARSSGARRA